MTPEEKYDNDFWYVLQKVKKEFLYHAGKDGSFVYMVYHPVLAYGQPNPSALPAIESNPSDDGEIAMLRKLTELDAIKLLKRHDIDPRASNPYLNESRISLKVLQPKFDEEYEKMKIRFEDSQRKVPKNFEVTKKGSDILVNGIYLINKPHYNAPNELFFDYAYRNPNRKVMKEELKADTAGRITKKLSSIINELGFTSEIRKAFFPKVSGKTAFYFRNPVTDKDISEDQIDIELLIQELKTQHLRKNKKKLSDSV